MTTAGRVRNIASATPRDYRANRRGSTLVELLVALPILAIVGAVAIAVLLVASRGARHADASATNGRELRHATLIVAAELRPLRSDDLIAWSDTSLEFESLVASGVTCSSRANSIDLLPPSTDDAAGMHLIAPMQRGDRVSGWNATRDGTGALSVTRVGAVVESDASTTGCERSPLYRGTRVVRVQLRDSLTRALQDGSPVRVTRRVRLTLYRAADNKWYLGRSSFDGTRWDVVQPVIGPLMNAASGGMTVGVINRTGARLPSGASGAAAVGVSFRAARGSGTTIIDSIAMTIALRGGTL